MKDRSLLTRSIRENVGICLMALALMAFGSLLLLVASEGPSQHWLPPWFFALPPLFWRVVGIFFACAACFAMLLCVLTIRHGYQHYLVENYGITRSAVVLSKEIEEIRLGSSQREDGGEPRRIRLGHVAYRYGMGGRMIEDSFILGDSEMDLFEMIEVGDQIPLRVLPHKPRRSTLHRERLQQQYRWRDSAPVPSEVALETD